MDSPFDFTRPDWSREIGSPDLAKDIFARFAQQQAQFGPPARFQDGGGSGPGMGQPTTGQQSNVTGPVDISFGNMISNAVQGQNLSNPNTGLFSGNLSAKGTLNTGINLGTKALSAVLGLGPLNMLSGPLNAVTNFALKQGLTGQDTSGIVSQAVAEANGFTSPDAMSIIAQGLGLSAGQLASINAAAQHGLDITTNLDGPTLSNIDAANAAAAAAAPSAADAAGAVAAGADPAGVANGIEDKGGYIGRKPRQSIDKAGHVPIKALRTEFVVNPKATKLRRTLLEAINSGASKAKLAGILKAGR